MASVILTSMVALSCTTQDTSSKNACANSIEAFSRQSGIYKTVEVKEKELEKKIEKKLAENLKTSTEAAASLILVTSVAAKNRTVFRLGKGPADGNYIFETDSETYKIGVSWDF